MIKKSRVLVTGASGFIGSKLCEELFSKGFDVYGVSRSNQSSAQAVKWIYGDLINREFVDQLFEKLKPNYIIHLASHVLGSRDFQYVISTMENNFLTSLNLLYSAKKHGCERIILAGSFEEGRSSWSSGQPNVPSSPYAASKIASSNYARMFHELYGVPVAMASIYMVYRPGQKDLSKLIPYVILTFLKGERPKVSSGVRKIDWIYVDDLVDGLIHMLSAPNIEGKTIELGSGRTFSVKDIVLKMASMIGSGLKPIFGGIEDRPLEQESVADINRTLKEIGWSAKTDIDTGLNNTIEYYKKVKK